MKKLEDLSKVEKVVLLFLEACAVEYGGTVDTDQMSKYAFLIAEKWNREGFINFGRIAYKDIPDKFSHYKFSHFVFLSENAWSLAHQERRERFKRMEAKRKWRTTSEKNKQT